MTHKILKSIGLVMVLGSFAGCIDKADEPDTNCYDEKLKVTTSIAALKTNYSGQVTEDVIIEGVIVADDKSGNFYKQIIIQDSSAGIAINIDRTEFYTDYPIGRKIYVKLKGLTIAESAGTIQVGIGIDPSGNLTRIPNPLVGEYIKKGGCRNAVKPLEVSIADLASSKYHHTLVTLKNVEFADNLNGYTFASPATLTTENRSLKDCSGKTLIVRTSGYASFAGALLPTGNGSLTGVYSVFNSDKQIFIRDLNDADSMTNKRCNGSSGNGKIILKEGFDNNASGDINISGWINYSNTSAVWKGGNFSGSNPYAQVSAFNAGSNDVKSWLITMGIDLGASSNEVLSFKSAVGYPSANNLFECLVSTDYSGSGDPSAATWTPLSFTQPTPPSSGNFGPFTASGDIDLSAYNGTVYIAWRYTGSASNGTATWELDNINLIGE